MSGGRFSLWADPSGPIRPGLSIRRHDSQTSGATGKAGTDSFSGDAMIWWRPVQTEPTRKSWWDTKLSRKFGAEGYAANLWVWHFFPHPLPSVDNDRDRADYDNKLTPA